MTSNISKTFLMGIWALDFNIVSVSHDRDREK